MKATVETLERRLIVLMQGAYADVNDYPGKENLEAYARRVGADWVVMKALPRYPLSGLLQYFKEGYDRILLVTDRCLIRGDTPHLFEMVAEEHLGGVEISHAVDPRDFRLILRAWEEEHLYRDQMIHDSVLVLSSRHAPLLHEPEPGMEMDATGEMYLFNYRILKNKVPVFSLDYRFNYLSTLRHYAPRQLPEAFIPNFVDTAPEFLPERQRECLQSWSTTSPGYFYPKDVVIIAGGGLGDHLCGLPVVEKILKAHRVKRDKIRIYSYFPDLYARSAEDMGIKLEENLHAQDLEKSPMALKFGVKVVNGRILTQEQPKVQYYHVYPSVGDQFSRYVSVCKTLMTDRLSLRCLEQTLPHREKVIHVVPDPDERTAALTALKDWKDHPFVTLHAGVTMQSRTLPLKVWQSYLDALIENQIRVVLIGQDQPSGQGVHRLVYPEGCTLVKDFRNRTTFWMTLALVHESAACLTNDSLWVHACSVARTRLLIFSVMRHPDHLFPYRHLLPEMEVRQGAFCTQMCIDTLYDQFDDGETDPLIYRNWDQIHPGELEALCPLPEIVLQRTREAIESRCLEMEQFRKRRSKRV